MDNSTSSDNGPCWAANINSDVSGVGVRASLYASVTIGLIMMRWFTHDMDAFQEAARSSFITSIALVFSALISLYNSPNGLALVDALVVTTVTSLVMAYSWIVGSQGTTYAKNLGSNRFELTYTLALFAIAHSALWMAFGIVVWGDPLNFGKGAVSDCFPDPNQSVVFWLFGHSVPVTSGSLRTFATFSFSAAGSVSIVWTFVGVCHARVSRNKVKKAGFDVARMRSEGPPEDAGALALAPIESPAAAKASHQPGASLTAAGDILPADESGFPSELPAVPGDVESQQPIPDVPLEKLNTVWKRAPLRTIMPVWKYASGWGGLAAYIYLIVTTESLITANGVRGATSSLTFGQILSLVLLLDQIVFQPMTQMFNSLLERAFEKQKLERRREQGRRADVRNGVVYVRPGEKTGTAAGPNNVGRITGVTEAQQFARDVQASQSS